MYASSVLTREAGIAQPDYPAGAIACTPSAAGFRHCRFVAVGRNAGAAPPPTSPPDMDAIGKLNAALADRYHPKPEIGHGGMATAYLADDLKHQHSVALNVLHPELGVILGANVS